MSRSFSASAWLLLAASTLLHPCEGGTFWHISDFHLDYEYVTGGNVSNWCHSFPETAGGAVSSINKEVVGPAGNYHCDSPLDLVMSSLEAMYKFQPRPDFIVWTGDSAPHWKDASGLGPNESYITNVTKKVFTKLDELFPRIPVVPALGNHDASPPDQFPIKTQEEKNPEYYTTLWKKGAFGDHIEEEGRESFQSCGFYTKVLNNSIRFVVLNTNIYYGDELTTGPDPCDQMDWLNTTLHNSNQTVFIVAHVPPGAFERGGKDGMAINFNRPNDTYHEINKRFVQIVTDSENAEKISGHLYGHLHTDTFRMFLDRAKAAEPRGVGFMAGSVTPIVWAKDGGDNNVVGTNPSIRLFTYRDPDFVLTDYSEYSLDILKANKEVDEEISGSANSIVPDSGVDKKRRKSLSANNKKRKRREAVDGVPKLPTSAGSPAPVAESVAEPDPVPTAVPKVLPTAVPEVLPTAVPEVLPTAVPEVPTSVPEVLTAITDPVSPVTPRLLVTAVPDPEVSTVTTAAPSILESELSKTEMNKVSGNAAPRGEPANNLKLKPVPAVPAKHPILISNLTSQWKLLYKATEAFNVSDLSAKSMFDAVKRMVSEKFSAKMFQTYYAHNTAGHKWKSCDAVCWRQHLCTITKLVETELNTCLHANGTSGFFYQPPQAINTTSVNETLITNSSHVPNDNDNLTTFPPQSYNTPQDTESSEDIDVLAEKIEDQDFVATRAVSIFFGIVGVLLLLLVGFFGYKKYKESRYRNQEFLLTDSVFRYDGYSQLDDD